MQRDRYSYLLKARISESSGFSQRVQCVWGVVVVVFDFCIRGTHRGRDWDPENFVRVAPRTKHCMPRKPDPGRNLCRCLTGETEHFLPLQTSHSTWP